MFIHSSHIRFARRNPAATPTASAASVAALGIVSWTRGLAAAAAVEFLERDAAPPPPPVSAVYRSANDAAGSLEQRQAAAMLYGKVRSGQVRSGK